MDVMNGHILKMISDGIENNVLVAYLCDKKACRGKCPNDLCNHTFNKDHAINKDELNESLFRCIMDESGVIIAFEEIELPIRNMDEILGKKIEETENE